MACPICKTSVPEYFEITLDKEYRKQIIMNHRQEYEAFIVNLKKEGNLFEKVEIDFQIGWSYNHGVFTVFIRMTNAAHRQLMPVMIQQVFISMES